VSADAIRANNKGLTTSSWSRKIDGLYVGSRQLISPSDSRGSWDRSDSIGPTRRMTPLDASTATNRSSDSSSARGIGNGEAEVVESSAFEHRRAEAVDRRVVPGHLEDLQHDLLGEEHGLASLRRPGTEQGRLESADLLVEDAVAVQIPRHHGDAADPTRHAHRAPVRTGPHTMKAFTGWNESFRAT
jgi:hypothetical protein